MPLPGGFARDPCATSSAEWRREAQRSAEYRDEEARLAPFEQVARVVIGRRIELGITQEQFAERMKTSASTISPN